MGVVLLVGCAGLVTLDADGVPTSDYVIGQSDARDGQEALDRHFPAGSGAPAYLLVPDINSDEAQTRVAALYGVQSVSEAAEAETPVAEGHALIEVTLTDDPYSDAAENTVREMRDQIGDLGGMVGGTTATDLDTKKTSVADRSVIIPVVLLVISVMLMLLLRAVVAPLVLLATTVLSFGTALGVGAALFAAFGFSGSDPSVPPYTFVFLVALATVASFQIVGTLLVFGLLIGPPATAVLLVRGIGRVMVLAAVLGVVQVYVGLLVSWYAETAAGATITLLGGLTFFVVLAVREVVCRVHPANANDNHLQ